MDGPRRLLLQHAMEGKGLALATNDIDDCCWERVNEIHIIFQIFFSRFFLEKLRKWTIYEWGKDCQMCVSLGTWHINNLFDNFQCIFNAMSVEII